jgi:hypothetical protein
MQLDSEKWLENRCFRRSKRSVFARFAHQLGINPFKQVSTDAYSHKFPLANLENMSLSRVDFKRRVFRLLALNAHTPSLDEAHGFKGTLSTNPVSG